MNKNEGHSFKVYNSNHLAKSAVLQKVKIMNLLESNKTGAAQRSGEDLHSYILPCVEG